MDLQGRAVALYGRFSVGVRDGLQRQIAAARGTVARDLMRRSDVLVIGALATALIDSGALPQRLRAAAERSLPTFAEAAFLRDLEGEAPALATLPLTTALTATGLTPSDAAVLAAFDLVSIDGENCRFGDATALRTASELIRQGSTLGAATRILLEARDVAPTGRRKVVLTPTGEPALQWDDGVTTLAGQGVLPLDEDHASIDDLFEAASLAESAGDLGDAARLYDMCARADRKDAIALYNFGNIRMSEGVIDEAALAYRRALQRDAKFLEARYNLAQTLEAAGKPDEADLELSRVLKADGTYADAAFNLAQLRMKAGKLGEAKALYEHYLRLGPPDEWAATARRAILYCATQLAG
jgi:tetratricopeptide (TPR) repeat protein